MPKDYDRTFHLRHYPLPKLVAECIKCGRKGRFDLAQLIEKLRATYPVHQAKDRLTKDWMCDKPDRMPGYALHPRAMYCLSHLPEWLERVDQFFLDVNYGRKSEPLYASSALLCREPHSAGHRYSGCARRQPGS
jgi:hypothetical protein